MYVTNSRWSWLNLPKKAWNWYKNRGNQDVQPLTEITPPTTYFMTVVDGGNLDSQHFTASQIETEEALELLRSGKLVNLEGYDWIIHLLCLRLNVTVIMNEPLSDQPMTVFRAGDRFLMASFNRSGNPDDELTYESLWNAELVFSMGILH